LVSDWSSDVCSSDLHDAQLLAVFSDNANFGHANSLVNARGGLPSVVRALAATSKACSYCCTSIVVVQSPMSNVQCLPFDFGLWTLNFGLRY